MGDVYISKVYLLRVPLESDYKNTLYFTSAAEQQTYFMSKRITEFDNDDFSYIRKDQAIIVEQHIDQIRTCNYLMYQNSYYSNKWFYCFIKEMEYIHDGATKIYIETDVMQTYLFDFTVKESFIEREHVDNDSVGLHTVPENVETGEYVCNELVRDQNLRDYVYVILVSDTYDEERSKPLAINMGGIFYAGGAYVCETMNNVVSIINLYDQNGKGEAVTSVYMLPKAMFTEEELTDELAFGGKAQPITYEITLSKQTKLDGYSPRNNKLKCFPYNYLTLSNNTGSSNILQYEHFSGSQCEFEVAGIPVIGGSIKCAPCNYKGIERYQDEGIMCGKFPTLSWSSDQFTNWLTQNAVNIGLGVASGGLTVLGGIGMIASGGGALAGAGAVASGGLSIAQTIGQVYQQSFTPASAKGNVNGGDINTAYKMNTFYFHKMSIKKEYAQIIDKYFDMFGYKVNMVKTPNKAHRSRWWYTKTIDVNIDGNIPNDDMQKIKDCYNNGITFWRNASEIQNYSLTNGIV